MNAAQPTRKALNFDPEVRVETVSSLNSCVFDVVLVMLRDRFERLVGAKNSLSSCKVGLTVQSLIKSPLSIRVAWVSILF